jgi:prevent-host-death family protein
MSESVGVRELRQNLSKYLARVKDGESLTVTERGQEVAALIPTGDVAAPYSSLVARFGVTPPTERLEDVARRLPPRSSPAGTTDRYLAESRRDRGRPAS